MFARRPIKKLSIYFTQSPHLLTPRLSYRQLEIFEKNYKFVKYQVKLVLKTYYKLYILTLFRMGFSGAAHGWGQGFLAPSLESAPHILQ